MSRKSEVGFYKSKGGYYTTYKGQRYLLHKCDRCDKPDGPNYLAALEEFKKLMEGAAKVRARDDTVAGAIARRLDHMKEHHPASYAGAKSYLETARVRLGRLRCSELRKGDVTGWLDSQRQWSPSTKETAYRRFMSAINWNVEEGYISGNPLAGGKLPAGCQMQARGEDFVLPDNLVVALLNSARGPFRDFLTALAKTGARPGELANAEWYHYRPADHAIVFEADARRGYIWKCAHLKKHGDRNRTIYLPADVEEVVARNAARKGWLFPNSKGCRYRNANMTQRFHVILGSPAIVKCMKENGHRPEHVILYSFRHTFITTALKKGTPIKLLADLMGTSVSVIERNYSHASSDKLFMRGIFLQIVGEGGNAYDRGEKPRPKMREPFADSPQ